MEGGDVRMSSVDTRIVEMRFDNSQFERGVSQTLGTLGKLKQSMNLQGAVKGFDQISAASRRISFGPLNGAVDAVGQRFSAMTVVATTALATLANKATNVGLNLAKSLTIEPITGGLHEYETNLKAIQTILANTQSAGTTLEDVNGALEELNRYSDQTIYNFAEMAKNIGTFTAAGVDLETATGSIKGIANLAALSGSNSMQASTAMYQLSQAISAGRVSLQDWNSVVNAGMGGTVFQRALAQTAERMGTLDKGAVKLTGKMKNATINGKSFRESITAKPGQESWLTSEVLTKTLEQFTGDMTDAELAADGFSKAQIKAIQDQAKMAKSAATEVKTGTQLIETLQESAGSGWAQTWQLILGDFTQAKKLWTGVNDVLGGFINKQSEARNNMLKEWQKFGGRTNMLEGIKNLFNGLLSVLAPIRDAFRDIFPATTGAQLARMTKSFREFTENLKLGGDTAAKLRSTFGGVFAIFGIAWEVIKQVASSFLELFSVASKGGNSFLTITASIGEFLISLHKAIKEGDGLKAFFDGLVSIIKQPLEAIAAFGRSLAGMFDGMDSSKLSGATKGLTPLAAIGRMVRKAWDGAVEMFGNLGDSLGGAGSAIGEFFSNIGTWIKEGIAKVNMDDILGGLTVGGLAGLVLTIRKFGDKFGEALETFTDFKETILGPFEQLTSTLSTMQNTLRAMTLLQIAAAVGILAASMVALSRIDAGALKKALGAMSILFLQLAVTMAVFQKISISGGMGQLILLAASIRILTSAVVALAAISWQDLAKGLTGVAALLAAIVVTAKLMPDGAKMISSSLGILILSAAVRVLAGAVTKLSGLSWEEMTKGLISVGALLAGLGLFTKMTAANRGGMLQAVGILILAAAMNVLAGAVERFGKIDTTGLVKGLLGFGVALGIITLALSKMPKSTIISAAAIAIVAFAMEKLAGAMEQMGKMKLGDVAKSLGLLAGMMLILSVGLNSMTTAIFGAAALVVVAFALEKLAPALQAMGDMSWGEIARGLVMLAGAMTIISIAMGAMTTAIFGAAALVVVAMALKILQPVLQAMGDMDMSTIAKSLIVLAGALTIISIAMGTMTTAIFGAAALVVVALALKVLQPVLQAMGEMSWGEIAKGLTLLAASLTIIAIAGVLLLPAIPGLIGLGLAIGILGVGLLATGLAVLAFAKGIQILATVAQNSQDRIIGMVRAFIGVIPEVGRAIAKGLVEFAKVIAVSGPAITRAMTTVITSFLSALNKTSPRIISTFTNIMTQLLAAVRRMSPQISATMQRLLNDLLNAAVRMVPRMTNAGMQILIGFLNGIAARIGQVVTAATNVIVAFLDGIAANMPRIIDAGMRLAVSFVNGVANGIRNNSGSMTAAGMNLASAIVQGMVIGIAQGIASVTSAASNLAGRAIAAAKARLSSKSPSKVFIGIGNDTAAGMAIGLTEGVRVVAKASSNMAGSALDATRKTLGIHSPSREFKKLGLFAAKGFVKGMDGGKDEIRRAIAELKSMIHNTIKEVQTDISALEARLKKLNKAKRKDRNAIRKTERALAEAREELRRSRNAQSYAKTWGDEVKALDKLSYKANKIARDLDAARSKLADAKRTRDDFKKSITEQYSDLPDFDGETKYDDYIKSFQKQIVDTQIYAAQLQKLRKMGLNGTMYKELLAKGPEAIPFVTEILNKGKGGVKELNTLGSTLSKNAASLGNYASTSLYQAGVDAAAGLVKGLVKDQKAIEKAMDRIAAVMIRRLKNRLGIKSPSREFMKLGDFSIQGLAKGFESSDAAVKAAEASGKNLVETMRKTISKMPDILDGNLDGQPTIRPILDLTDVKKNSSQISGLFGDQGISAFSSYSGAKAALHQKRFIDNLKAEALAPEVKETPPPVQFNQTINSPKAISEAEVYRQTRNQLSTAKGALTP